MKLCTSSADQRPTPGKAQPADRARSYQATLEQFSATLGTDWRVEDRGGESVPWRIFLPVRGNATMPTQGWKIHISAGISEVERLCHSVLPLLSTLGAPFK